MTLAPHPRSTAANLLRLLAAWLAVIVLTQGIGAARALGLGPLHRHSSASIAHHHDGSERHHHAAADASVLTSAAEEEPKFNAAAFALVAALALMALGQWHFVAETRRQVWRAAPSWAWLTALAAPLRRPPRRA